MEQCGGTVLVEQWNSGGGTLKSNSVVEQWNSGTVLVEQWNSENGTVEE